jgi:hypothetical protein
MRFSPGALALATTLALAACDGRTNKPGRGDPAGPPGDPGGGGDLVTGDTGTPTDGGDTTPGDAGGDDGGPGDGSQPVVIVPSTGLCAAGGAVASATYHGVVCLSPVGAGGPISTSPNYKLIPGPAHIVPAE